jgi:hypothetical protein
VLTIEGECSRTVSLSIFVGDGLDQEEQPALTGVEYKRGESHRVAVPESASGFDSRLSSPRRLLLVLVACLMVADLGLLVVSLDETEMVIRALLGAGTILAVGIGLVYGIRCSPPYAIGSLLAAPVAVLYTYSGLVLPWGQRSFHLGQQGIQVLLWVPLIGDALATTFFGEVPLSQLALQRMFTYHYAMVGLFLVSSLALLATRGWQR